MKRLQVLSMITVLLSMMLVYGCKKDGDSPIVIIGPVSNISSTGSTVSGTVTSEGNNPVTERGFVWSTQSKPSYETNEGKSVNGVGLGTFEYAITGLTNNTTYHVKAYAKSESGVGYSEEFTFTTSDVIVPTVTINPAKNITCKSATITASVISEGSGPVTERGFVWSTQSGPKYDINEGKSINGVGLGGFEHAITGLTNNTTYHVKAYAKSESGVGYSDESTFMTLDNPTESNQTITVKGVSFTMIAVRGGTFQMGDTFGGGYDDEYPIHSVTLSDYYIGETEVTQELWLAVMGSNPSYSNGSIFPVERVSWNDCQEFIKKLNIATGRTFRLPTEAEWEYAAKGGNKSKRYKYSGSNNLSGVGWYRDNSGENVHEVKSKMPNELGIYDMSGNVYEWCSDWYGIYSSNAQTNPAGTVDGPGRVKRGGSWSSYAEFCRVAYRYRSKPGDSYNDLGLRLAIVP